MLDTRTTHAPTHFPGCFWMFFCSFIQSNLEKICVAPTSCVITAEETNMDRTDICCLRVTLLSTLTCWVVAWFTLAKRGESFMSTLKYLSVPIAHMFLHLGFPCGFCRCGEKKELSSGASTILSVAQALLTCVRRCNFTATCDV